MLSFLRTCLGWNDPINVPIQSTLCVWTHTTYWDALMLLLYSSEIRVFAVIKPQYFNMFTEPFLNWLGFIKAPRLEDRSGGGVKAIADQIRVLSKGLPTLLLISPKGTIKNRPWRSGYKHIAIELGWPIRCMLVDYTTRTIKFSDDMVPDDSKLQNVLGHACPFVPARSELPIHDAYDNFELLCIFDSLIWTNLSMLPTILELYFIGKFYLFFLALCTMIISMIYHRERESKFILLDKIFAKLLIFSCLWTFRSNITIDFTVHLCIALIFYWAGTGRKTGNFRGPYIVFHSIFHVLMSLSAWKLVSHQPK